MAPLEHTDAAFAAGPPLLTFLEPPFLLQLPPPGTQALELATSSGSGALLKWKQVLRGIRFFSAGE
jgi:hypothetical protein